MGTNVTSGNRNWWIMLIMGILFIIFGIWIFRNPVESYLGLTIYFCIIFIIIGISEIAHAFTSADRSDWGWGFALGIIDLMIGCVLLFDLQWAEAALPYVVGFILMFQGIDFISASTQMSRMGISNWGWLLVGGILTLIFAFLIIFHPLFGVLNIIVWTGLAFIFGGVSAIIRAFITK
ncbi:MAG: HdeD family acid-resistance protein [Marinifilaceae bacterium]